MEKLIIFVLILTASLFSVGDVCANNTIDETIKLAELNYDSTHFNKALHLYLQIDSTLSIEGRRNSKIIVNIGTTYYKLDSLSKAILYYENAYKLNPYNKSTKENLAILYTKIMGEDITETDGIYILHTFFNPIILKVLYSITFVILLLSFLYIFLLKLKKQPLNKTYLISNFVIIIIISIYFLINSFYIDDFKYGVMDTDTSFYSEPINGRVIGTLYKGHKVRVIKKDENMLFFNYKNKITGWFDKDNLLMVE